MVNAKIRWGDALDEEEGFVPRTSISGPDKDGVTTKIEYKKNDKGEVTKVTTKTKTTTVERKVYKAAQERRHWARFGEAVKEVAGDSVTVQTVEDIPFERVRSRQTAEEKKAQDLKEALEKTDKAAASQSLKDLLYKKRMERQLMVARGLMDAPEKAPEGEDGPGGSSLPAPGGKSGYIPPSLRARMMAAEGGEGGESMRKDRREENSVRVTNLSEDTQEEDLRELFSNFGHISRVYLAKDREKKNNRGFAFVNFVRREDAAKAIQKLNGYGYDNLILRVEWAQPRESR